MAARRKGAKYQALTRASDDVFSLVSISELRWRAAHRGDRDRSGLDGWHIGEGGNDMSALGCQLRWIRQMLPHASATPTKRRAARSYAVAAKRPKSSNDPRPSLGAVRAFVIDRNFSPFARKKICDPDSHSAGRSNAEAALVERTCGNLALHGSQVVAPQPRAGANAGWLVERFYCAKAGFSLSVPDGAQFRESCVQVASTVVASHTYQID